MTTRIAIIGAGIAGLTLARALDPRHEVTLHEAQPERTGAGAALGLWASARRGLQALGVDLPVGQSGTRLVVRDLLGRRLVEGPAPDLELVSRPELMRSLEVDLPTRVRRRFERVEDPTDLDADLVIGADGVRSVVRPLVWEPAAQRRRTSWVALRGIAEDSATAHTVGEYWGADRLFGNAPLRAGRYWFTAHRSELGPEPLPVEAVLAEARERFRGAAPAITETLADAAATPLATRLWVVPAMPRYARDRFVVIGDAAHACLPNLGRGACDAILDALTLARTLNRAPSRRPSAGRELTGWQARRVPATQVLRTAAGVMMAVETNRFTDRASEVVLDRFRSGAGARSTRARS